MSFELLDLGEERIDPGNVVRLPGERRAQHGRHPDRALVYVRLHVLGAPIV